jgi:hypothetical protein
MQKEDALRVMKQSITGVALGYTSPNTVYSTFLDYVNQKEEEISGLKKELDKYRSSEDK